MISLETRDSTILYSHISDPKFWEILKLLLLYFSFTFNILEGRFLRIANVHILFHMLHHRVTSSTGQVVFMAFVPYVISSKT